MCLHNNYSSSFHLSASEDCEVALNKNFNKNVKQKQYWLITKISFINHKINQTLSYL